MGNGLKRNHNNFYENLEFAQRNERIIGEHFVKYVDVVRVEYNDTNTHDITVFLDNGIVFRLEVKEDVRVKDTGNVVVEYQSRGKRSGISVTKADFWMFVLHLKKIRFFLISVDRIKLLIKNKEYSRKYQMPYTDSKNKVYFFKKDVIIKNSKELSIK